MAQLIIGPTNLNGGLVFMRRSWEPHGRDQNARKIESVMSTEDCFLSIRHLYGGGSADYSTSPYGALLARVILLIASPRSELEVRTPELCV